MKETVERGEGGWIPQMMPLLGFAYPPEPFDRLSLHRITKRAETLYEMDYLIETSQQWLVIHFGADLNLSIFSGKSA
jgi:hypothetical protein